MTLGTAQDLSSQVVSIPMNSFGLLMNSPDSEFQRISPEKTLFSSLYSRFVGHSEVAKENRPHTHFMYSRFQSVFQAAPRIGLKSLEKNKPATGCL
jgi:hypothetical protein